MAAPPGKERTFRMRVRFQKENEEWMDGGIADWNEEWVGWQYTCGAAVAAEAYQKIRVYIEYDANLNEAEIGAVSLVKEYYCKPPDNAYFLLALPIHYLLTSKLDEGKTVITAKHRGGTRGGQSPSPRERSAISIRSSTGGERRTRSGICPCGAGRPWG